MLFKLPNNLKQVESQYLPSYLVGYEHFWYNNSDELYDDADFANWNIGLFNISGVEVENLGTLTKDIITAPDFRFYKLFTITAEVTGKHFFGIYNSATGVPKLQFNLFNVISEEQAVNYTLVEWRHSTNRDNFNYEGISNYNSVFLDLVNLPNEYEYTDKVVIDAVTGDVRRQKNQQSTVLNFETQLFDRAANEAMASLSGHDDILLNKEIVTVKQGHKAETLRDYDCSNGLISFYYNARNRVNLNG